MVAIFSVYGPLTTLFLEVLSARLKNFIIITEISPRDIPAFRVSGTAERATNHEPNTRLRSREIYSRDARNDKSRAQQKRARIR